MQGFTSASADKVNVTINARQRVDLILRVGQVAEVVSVEGAAPLLESDSSSKGQVISYAAGIVKSNRGEMFALLREQKQWVHQDGNSDAPARLLPVFERGNPTEGNLKVTLVTFKLEIHCGIDE